MSQRESCLSLISTHGYISRNILSRFLKISLQNSIRVLESVLPLANSTVLYSTCIGNKVTIHRSNLSNSLIYAIGLNSFKSDFFDIEMKLKSFFYQSEDIAYPPSAVGIFIQEKRNVVLKDRVVKKLPIVKKIEAKKVGTIENPSLKGLDGRERCEKGRQGDGGIGKVRDCAKDMVGVGRVGGKIEKSSGGNVKGEERIDLFEAMLKEDKKLLINEENRIEAENSLFVQNNEVGQVRGKKGISRLNEKRISKVSDDGTKGHIKDNLNIETGYKTLKKHKNEINDILSNKNLYHTEEDEDYCTNTPIKTQIRLESSVAKDCSQDTLPQKNLKPNNDFFKSNAPMVQKRKILKTRTVIEDEKLITEDYSSEELIEIPRPSNVLGKKEGVQQKINFSKRVNNN